MSYVTQYYSRSTGEHRVVVVPTPASSGTALIAYEPKPIIPYTGSHSAFLPPTMMSTTAAELPPVTSTTTTTTTTTSTTNSILLAPNPWGGTPTPFGGYSFVPMSTTSSPPPPPPPPPPRYGSWYHPPTYAEALAQVYARPREPRVQPTAVAYPPPPPPLTLAHSHTLGPYFTTTTPPVFPQQQQQQQQQQQPPPFQPPLPQGWYHPPVYGRFLAEYAARPTQPLLHPIQVSPSPALPSPSPSPQERTYLVGRVERHVLPYS